MNFIHAIILGVIEGATEFLPVSSTGHLVLAVHAMRISQTAFSKSFEIAIQLGAILSIIVLYWKKLFLDKEVIKKITAAFIPTGVSGLLIYKIVKSIFLESEKLILWSLALGGIIIILFELLRKEAGDDSKTENGIREISYLQAFIIGVCQSVAMIPGVSRAAATIIGGMALGIKRKTIVEFSFLLAVPTMLAATGYDLLKNASLFSSTQWHLFIWGFAVSFVVALASVEFLLFFIKKHRFTFFGVYRILIALIFWWRI